MTSKQYVYSPEVCDLARTYFLSNPPPLLSPFCLLFFFFFFFPFPRFRLPFQAFFLINFFRPLSSPLSCRSTVLKFLVHRLPVQSPKLFLLCRPFMGQLRGSEAYHQLPRVVFAPALARRLDLNEG